MGSKKAGAGAAAATLRKRLVQVRACERTGESLKAYAARHGISVHSLYQAKKQARQQGLLRPHGAEKAASHGRAGPGDPGLSRRSRRRRSHSPDIRGGFDFPAARYSKAALLWAVTRPCG